MGAKSVRKVEIAAIFSCKDLFKKISSAAHGAKKIALRRSRRCYITIFAEPKNLFYQKRAAGALFSKDAIL